MSWKSADSLSRDARADPNDKDLAIQNLIARSRIEGSRVFLECLSDRLLWNHAPASLQDVVISEVATRLEPRFQFVDTKEFQCGGSRHRIASFRHSTSLIVCQLLPGDVYLMGADSPPISSPVHQVSVEPFLLARTPTTRRQWATLNSEECESKLEHPATHCSWNDVHSLPSGLESWRLPSEAEWEYACRAGTTSRYFFGEELDLIDDYVWHRENAEDYQPVALKKPNAFGLFDMMGNVQELCADDFITHYKHGPFDQKPMRATDPVLVSTRGCSHFSEPRNCFSASRSCVTRYEPRHLGFRLCWSLSDAYIQQMGPENSLMMSD